MTQGELDFLVAWQTCVLPGLACTSSSDWDIKAVTIAAAPIHLVCEKSAIGSVADSGDAESRPSAAYDNWVGQYLVAFERLSDESARIRELKKFVKEHDVSYTVLHGGRTGGDVQKVFPTLEEFVGFPTAIFIGRDGKVKEIKIGFDGGRAEQEEKHLAEIVERLLAEQAS